MDERSLFEGWATKRGLVSKIHGQALDYPLGRILWECWQARASLDTQTGKEAPVAWKIASHLTPDDGPLLICNGEAARIYAETGWVVTPLYAAPPASMVDVTGEKATSAKLPEDPSA